MSLSTAFVATHVWQLLDVLYCCAILFSDKLSGKKIIKTQLTSLENPKIVKALHTYILLNLKINARNTI